jgi:hypothetical protein
MVGRLSSSSSSSSSSAFFPIFLLRLLLQLKYGVLDTLLGLWVFVTRRMCAYVCYPPICKHYAIVSVPNKNISGTSALLTFEM